MLFGLPIITTYLAFEARYSNVFIFAFKEVYFLLATVGSDVLPQVHARWWL